MAEAELKWAFEVACGKLPKVYLRRHGCVGEPNLIYSMRGAIRVCLLKRMEHCWCVHEGDITVFNQQDGRSAPLVLL